MTSAILNLLKAVAGNRWVKWLAAPLAVAAIVGSVVGAGGTPPVVNLAAEPLYARGARA